LGLLTVLGVLALVVAFVNVEIEEYLGVLGDDFTVQG